MRVVLLACFAAVLVTCAPLEQDAPRPDCTGTRTYERLLIAPHARARVRYRERTSRNGEALRVVRHIDAVEPLEGELRAEVWPTDLVRIVTAPLDDCPTADPPLAPADVELREETRLLRVTKTW